MTFPFRDRAWIRQVGSFVAVGGLQLALDWAVFVALTWWGMSPALGNLVARFAGALLGFWLNGRVTFAAQGQARLGWKRFSRFVPIWLLLTVVSTVLMALISTHLGLQQAWMAKPLVEGALAVAAFFLWRNVVYR